LSVSAETGREPQAEPRYVNLLPGDPAPWFHQQTSHNPAYHFASAAGRYILLGFFGTNHGGSAAKSLALIETRRELFDDDRLSFFGVTADPRDRDQTVQRTPGIRYFWDLDLKASRLYGAAPQSGEGDLLFRRQWILLDPMLRVIAVTPMLRDGSELPGLIARLEALPPVAAYPGIEIQAPIIYLPNVFEPELCSHLVELYERHGGEESGFMREVDGKTVGVRDAVHKSRSDYVILEEDIQRMTRARVSRRIVPEILKVHQFEATRMERYIVACYSAEERGHFLAHRDNTTSGTAHRRFAVSINLNDDFDGGEISFPEFGPRSYKPPVGGAVVFSCSLLHRVTPMTRGRRYAFLPFLYDDAAAALREANNTALGEGVGPYKS
jgi:predicted 2-oxoglutarate/Fe(II)-dependent dioxygenase YbiX/peroxiredoxin